MIEHGCRNCCRPAYTSWYLAMGRHPRRTFMRYSLSTKLHSWRPVDDGRSLECLRFRWSAGYSTYARIAVAHSFRSTDAGRVLAPCDSDDRGRRPCSHGEGRCVPHAASHHPAAHSRSVLHAGAIAHDRRNPMGQAAASMISAQEEHLRMVTRAKRLTLDATMGAMYVLRHSLAPRALLAILSPQSYS